MHALRMLEGPSLQLATFGSVAEVLPPALLCCVSSDAPAFSLDRLHECGSLLPAAMMPDRHNCLSKRFTTRGKCDTNERL